MAENLASNMAPTKWKRLTLLDLSNLRSLRGSRVVFLAARVSDLAESCSAEMICDDFARRTDVVFGVTVIFRLFV